MDTKLVLAIPTYRRITALRRSSEQIRSEINKLPEHLKRGVSIVYLENPSDQTSEKLNWLDSCFRNANVDYRYEISATRLEGDENINRAFSVGSSGEFTWVLGDDDIIHENALRDILLIINGHGDKLSGICLAARTPKYNAFKNFQHYVLDRLSNDAFDLILFAHIAACVFRSSLYMKEIAEQSRINSLINKSIPIGFFHAEALFAGLLRADHLAFVSVGRAMYDGMVLRQSVPEVRAEADASNPYILSLYYFFLLYAAERVGVRLEECVFPGNEPPAWLKADRSRPSGGLAIESRLKKLSSSPPAVSWVKQSH